MKLGNKFLAALLFWCFSAKAQDGLLVAVQQKTDSIIIFDLMKQVRTAQLPIGHMPHEICYDNVSKKCFITNFGVEDYDNRIGKPGNSISVIDPFSRLVVKEIYTGSNSVANCPHGIKVRPGKARELFVNIEIGDSMLVYNVDKFTIKRAFLLPGGAHNFIFSPTGDSLWVMAGENGVYQINPENGDIIKHKIFSSPIRGLAIIKQGLLASGKNELFILSQKDLSTIKYLKNLQVGQILYSTGTHDGKYILCPAVYDNIVLVIDAATGVILNRLQTGKKPINIQVTNDYAYVSHYEDYHITKIDLNTFQIFNNINAYGTNGIAIIK